MKKNKKKTKTKEEKLTLIQLLPLIFWHSMLGKEPFHLSISSVVSHHEISNKPLMPSTFHMRYIKFVQRVNYGALSIFLTKEIFRGLNTVFVCMLHLLPLWIGIMNPPSFDIGITLLPYHLELHNPITLRFMTRSSMNQRKLSRSSLTFKICPCSCIILCL